MTNRQGTHGGQVYVVNWAELATNIETPVPVIDPSGTQNLQENPDADHHSVTITGTPATWESAGSFTFHENTTHVEWRSELASARYRVDGGNPVAGVPGVGVGLEIKPNDSNTWSVQKSQAAIFVANTPSNTIFQVIELMEVP